MVKKLKLGLIGKLLVGIILGIVFGLVMPVWFNRIIITAAKLFSSFLMFVIPLMILAFVTKGIADLSSGAGKLLLVTGGISCGSTLIAGTVAFMVAINLFPHFLKS